MAGGKKGIIILFLIVVILLVTCCIHEDEISVSVTPKEVEPGENVLIDIRAPESTEVRVTIENEESGYAKTIYGGPTNSDGTLELLIPISSEDLGRNIVIVEALELGLWTSNSFTVLGKPFAKEQTRGIEKEIIKTEKINPNETQIIEFEGGSVTIPFGAINDNATLTVAVLKKYPEPDDAEIVRAISVELEDAENLNGYIEIRLRNTGSHNVVALTFNESLGKWEEILYSFEGDEVVIYTPHLSYFALAAVKTESGPMAKAKYISSLESISISESEAISVLQEYMENNYNPGPKAFRVGWDTASMALGLGKQPFTVAQHGLGFQSLKIINKQIARIGVGFAAIQLGIDLYEGDMTKAGLNFIKNSICSYVSLYGSPLLKLKFVGVFFIDYSISELHSVALSSEEEQWKRLYDAYYKTKMKRSPKDWYQKFWEIYSNSKMDSAEEFKEKIDKEIDNYVNAFWSFVGTDEYALWVQDYVDIGQASHAWAAAQTPHVSVKKKLAENHKAELLYSLQPVFQKLGRDIILEQKWEVLNHLKRIKEELNKVYTVNVKIKGPKDYVSGLKVYIPVINGDPEEWVWVTDENGEATVRFTLYGFLKAQAPMKIAVITKDGEKIEKAFTFEGPLRETTVTIDLKVEGAITVSVSPTKVQPGDTVTITAQVTPPGIYTAKITITNLNSHLSRSFEWTTDKNGKLKFDVNIHEDNIEQKLGENEVIVEILALGVRGKATFYVTAPEVTTTVTPEEEIPETPTETITPSGTCPFKPNKKYRIEIEIKAVDQNMEDFYLYFHCPPSGTEDYKCMLSDNKYTCYYSGYVSDIGFDTINCEVIFDQDYRLMNIEIEETITGRIPFPYYKKAVCTNLALDYNNIDGKVVVYHSDNERLLSSRCTAQSGWISIYFDFDEGFKPREEIKLEKESKRIKELYVKFEVID